VREHQGNGQFTPPPLAVETQAHDALLYVFHQGRIKEIFHRSWSFCSQCFLLTVYLSAHQRIPSKRVFRNFDPVPAVRELELADRPTFGGLRYNIPDVVETVKRRNPFAKVRAMKMTKFLMLLAVAALWISACFAQSACAHKRFFGGEEDPCLDKASSPSPPVVTSILNTNEANETFADMEPADRASVSKLLKGLTVHLRNEQQKDMIVRGDFPMSGGDNTWFWIVTSADSRPSAFWVQGNMVTILDSRHNGYSDIRTDWAAGSHRATRIFRYDGHRYKVFRETYEDLPPA
jgi:hypothetical protein